MIQYNHQFSRVMENSNSPTSSSRQLDPFLGSSGGGGIPSGATATIGYSSQQDQLEQMRSGLMNNNNNNQQQQPLPPLPSLLNHHHPQNQQLNNGGGAQQLQQSATVIINNGGGGVANSSDDAFCNLLMAPSPLTPSSSSQSEEIWDLDSNTVKRYSSEQQLQQQQLGLVDGTTMLIGADPSHYDSYTQYGGQSGPTNGWPQQHYNQQQFNNFDDQSYQMKGQPQQAQMALIQTPANAQMSAIDQQGMLHSPEESGGGSLLGTDGPNNKRPKSHQCESCDKWFTSSGHLKRHFNTTLHKNAMRHKSGSTSSSSTTPSPRLLTGSQVPPQHQSAGGYELQQRQQHQSINNYNNVPQNSAVAKNTPQGYINTTPSSQAMILEPRQQPYQTDQSLQQQYGTNSPYRQLPSHHQQTLSNGVHLIGKQQQQHQSRLMEMDQQQQQPTYGGHLRVQNLMLSAAGGPSSTSPPSSSASQTQGSSQQDCLYNNRSQQQQQRLLATASPSQQQQRTINNSSPYAHQMYSPSNSSGTPPPSQSALQKQQQQNMALSMSSIVVTNSPGVNTLPTSSPSQDFHNYGAYASASATNASLLQHHNTSALTQVSSNNGSQQQQQPNNSASNSQLYSTDFGTTTAPSPALSSLSSSFGGLNEDSFDATNLGAGGNYSPHNSVAGGEAAASVGQTAGPSALPVPQPAHPPPTTTGVGRGRGKRKAADNKDADENGEYRCVECDKLFSRLCYLKQHNKTFHNGEKPYKCNQCGKRFSADSLYQEHMAKHAGDKPYKCDVCPKQFNHKTDLRRHMCLHTGEKPFACDVCGKGFIREDRMLKHSDTHKKKQAQQATTPSGTPTTPQLAVAGHQTPPTHIVQQPSNGGNQSNYVPTTPTIPPGTPQGLPGTPQGLPGTPQALPGTSQGLPGTPQGLPGTSQGLPGTPQGTQDELMLA